MGFYDSKLKIDSGLIDNMGGTGKAFAYLGKSLSDVSEDERKKRKENQDEVWKQKIYQDSRADRSEDVNFRNNNAEREQKNFDAKMNFTKEESNREQKNFDTKFNFQKEKVNQAENKENDSNVSKAKIMREYLTSNGVDTKGYSNKDLIYAGDIIEKTHTDKSDYKFSQIIYKDKEPFAMYKNSKGETKIETLFGGGDGNGNTNQRDINEAKAQKKYEEYLKKKFGSTSTINID